MAMNFVLPKGHVLQLIYAVESQSALLPEGGQYHWP